MNNGERWKTKILEILKEDDVAVVEGVPKYCYGTKCEHCNFDISNCYSNLIVWLLEECDEA